MALKLKLLLEISYKFAIWWMTHKKFANQDGKIPIKQLSKVNCCHQSKRPSEDWR